jgi:hypothetical protein
MSVVVSEVFGVTNLVAVSTPGPQGIQGPAGSGSYTTPLTVAQLPSAPQSTRAMVTDSTTAAFYAVPSGGGTFVVPVYFDGTNWRVG